MRITTYLHGSKEDNYSNGKEAGLSEKALEYFMYANYEVKIDLEVDEKTGASKIVAVDGRELM